MNAQQKSLIGLGNLAAALCALGCGAHPTGFAAGNVARLSVLGVGAITAAINADDRCGFESPEALSTLRVDGKTGGHGSATLTVRNCELDLGHSRKELSTDCNGHSLWAQGRVTVSARRTITGYLTGDPKTPVIPDSADGVSVRILSAEGHGFEAGTTAADASVELKEGSVSALVQPRLAASISSGLCMVQTPIVSISEVVYDHARLNVRAKGLVKLGVSVTHSDFSAHAGEHGDRANDIAGSITMLGRTIQFPAEDDDGRLDPGYTPAAFLDSYACTPDLKLPVSFDCKTPVDMMAEPVAQLSVAALGAVVAKTQADTNCGFSSPDIVGHATVTGELGVRGGSATWTITNPCHIVVPSGTHIDSGDCAHPEPLIAGGLITVTGTMTLRGINTGDPLEPIIPTSQDPVEFNLHYTLDGFSVTPPLPHVDPMPPDMTFLIQHGTFDGVMKPRLALDTTLQLCAMPTPVMEVPSLTSSGAAMALLVNGMSVGIAASQMSVRAVNGKKDNVENLVAGNLVLGETPAAIAPNAKLNPYYDPADFNAYIACTPHLRIPTSDAECSGHRMLAENGARLLVLAVGAAARVAQESPQCGLPQMSGLPPPPSGLQPQACGFDLQWKSDACHVNATDSVIFDACNDGRKVHATGDAVISASLGMCLSYLPIPPYGPMQRDGVNLGLTNIQPGHWSMRITDTPTPPNGRPVPDTDVTFSGGTLSGTMLPIMGESTLLSHLFIIPTPIAGTRDLVANGVDVTIRPGAKTMKFHVDAAHFDAFAGSYGGQRNFINGTISIDGVPFSLDMMPLDPDYNQRDFDQSYSCTPNLRELVPSN